MSKFILLDKDKAKKAVETLEKTYPNQKYYLNFSNPLELLVAAILSAQTRDVVVNSITPALFKKYKTAKDYSSANESELLKYVSKVTFAGNKAKNIITACSILDNKYSGKVPNKMEELVALPGVGRKTANTILINAYGIIEGIPVDTWVIKISSRLGLTENKKPDDIEKDLMGLVEKNHWKNIAYVFKAHGHEICRSTAPLCSKCVLKEICPKNGVSKSE
jgi:endonuclease-3